MIFGKLIFGRFDIKMSQYCQIQRYRKNEKSRNLILENPHFFGNRKSLRKFDCFDTSGPLVALFVFKISASGIFCGREVRARSRNCVYFLVGGFLFCFLLFLLWAYLQVVPFCSPISEMFLFSLLDATFPWG